MGADPNPPITHMLVHYSRLAFGDHELAYRLPPFFGYWLGLVSLFAYLLRRLPAVWALAGTVLSMAMAAFDYSFESRSYPDLLRPRHARHVLLGVTVDDSFARCGCEISRLPAWCLRSPPVSPPTISPCSPFFPVAGGELTRTVCALVSVPRRSGRAGACSPASHRLSYLDRHRCRSSPLLAYRSEYCAFHRPVRALCVEQGVPRRGVRFLYRDGRGGALSHPGPVRN